MIKSLISAILICFSLIGVSQELTGGAKPRSKGPSTEFLAGIKAGVAATQIDGDGYSGWDKGGFTGGVFVYRQLTSKWSGQLEMLYTMKGSRDPSDPDNNKYDYYQIDLNYIDVPIGFQYEFSMFRAELGGSFSVLASSREWDEAGTVIQESLPIKPFEVALFLGGYWEATEKLVFNIRYAHSLLPVANETRFLPAQFGLFGGSYNYGFHFTLYYVLNNRD